MCLKNHQMIHHVPCPFHLSKIDCAFNFNFLFWFNNGFSICVLWSGGNGNWNLHTSCFSYDKFICDNEVNFTKIFKQYKFIISYVFINKCFYLIITIDSIFWCVFYPQKPMIMFTASSLKLCYEKKSYTCPNNVFVNDNNL
jgi:hypothetical protein